MKLSPKNLRTFSQITAQVFTLGIEIPVGPADSFALYLIALYMSRDDEARSSFEIQLEKYGDFVPEVWRLWYDQVMRDNNQDLEASSLDVDQLLRRLKDGDFGQGPGSKSQ